jgi:hypothetical protein
MKKGGNAMFGKVEKWSKLWLMTFQVFPLFFNANGSSGLWDQDD